MTKHLNIQQQLDKIDKRSCDAIIEAAIEPFDFQKSSHDAHTVNWLTEPLSDKQLRDLWQQLSAVIAKNTDIKNSTIIVAQGYYGWDDYLLLHHFDDVEALDKLPESKENG